MYVCMYVYACMYTSITHTYTRTLQGLPVYQALSGADVGEAHLQQLAQELLVDWHWHLYVCQRVYIIIYSNINIMRVAQYVYMQVLI